MCVTCEDPDIQKVDQDDEVASIFLAASTG